MVMLLFTFSNSSVPQPLSTWTFFLVLSCKRGFTTFQLSMKQRRAQLSKIRMKLKWKVHSPSTWNTGTNLPTRWEYIWNVNYVICFCLFWIVQVIYCSYSSQKLKMAKKVSTRKASSGMNSEKRNFWEIVNKKFVNCCLPSIGSKLRVLNQSYPRLSHKC